MSLYIGLMSGTSMDGIDAALVDVENNRLLCGITKKYSNELKKNIENVLIGTHLSLASICQLNTLIGQEFAAAANDLLAKSRLFPKDIAAIGSHGQTLCHNTNCTIPYTMQLGCGHTISSLTGITVVADFRTRDLVNGGQGAPYAPLYHQELFSSKEEDLAVVNIGGITNITLLRSEVPLQGWDVGPGNCLMDAWIKKHLGKDYDEKGEWAQQGQLIESLLQALMQDHFIRLSAPKSIGKEYFSLSWLDTFLKKEYKPEDVQNTLLAFTAQTIAHTLLAEHHSVSKLYLCGGGVHNQALFRMLLQLLPNYIIKSVAEKGVSPDYLEAMMFAWLADKTIKQIPIDLSTITGSKGPVILGAIYSNT